MVVNDQETLDKLLMTVLITPKCFRPGKIFIAFKPFDLKGSTLYVPAVEGRDGEMTLRE